MDSLANEPLAKLQEDVLASLEAPPELLPFLDELLADLPNLGTDPAAVVRYLRPLLPPVARVLDLGCGSGIVTVALAVELGAHVEGIDGYPLFVERARARAQAAGAGGRCAFRTGDLREALTGSGRFDAVLFGAVGDVLGSLGETVVRLRQEVAPGGLLILDHAFALREKDASPGYPVRSIALAALTSAGDALLAEVVSGEAEIRAANERNNRLLRARAAAIGRREPKIKDVLERYLDRQRAECDRLESAMAPVLWILRRAT